MEHSQTEITAGQIMGQLRAIAMANTTDLLSVREGQLEIRPTGEMDENLCAAIASMEKSAGGIKVKFYDKLKALELLGKAMGIFDRQPPAPTGESPLLRAILDSTTEAIDTHDIPELQQAAAAGDDLVEQTQFQK